MNSDIRHVSGSSSSIVIAMCVVQLVKNCTKFTVIVEYVQ